MMNNQEKYRLISVENSKIKLQKASKTLNKLMHNLNITAPQRVLYISGMLLAMQEIQDDDGTIISGLKPDDLKGYRRFSKMDGQIIVDRIREYLTYKGIERVKKELMMSSFNEIAKDQQRDIKTKVSKIVDKMFIEEATPNKQIFYYIYENIYKVIDTVNAHVDVMGEMYSEFLKYALGDGKEIGIILTPPEITQLMAKLVEVNSDSRVLDLATGFRVIIMTEANSSVKSKVLKLLPKLKTEETDGLCVA